MRVLACWVLPVFGMISLAAPLVGQRNQPVVGALAVALGAERRGDLDLALENFRLVLVDRPADIQAIVGLSRVLPALDRRSELMAPLDSAIVLDSTNTGLLALAVRNWTLLGETDSAAAYAARWSELAGDDPGPYREWALSALEIRNHAAARRALELGRQQLSDGSMLAPELAQLDQAEGNVANAAREWLQAIKRMPSYRASAVLLLAAARPDDHDAVLKALADQGGDEARRLRGLLLMTWGDPAAGVAELIAVMPESAEQALTVARLAVDALKDRRDRVALEALARIKEILADREQGEARVRSWMAAAEAWADAGNETEARRLLALIAADPAAPDGVATSAANTLLAVLLAEGRMASADSLYRSLAPSLTLDERDAARRKVALAFARGGEIDRARALMASDSSVAGFDVRGRLSLLAGDIGEARNWLRLAGPYSEVRQRAVDRVQMLALLAAVKRDTLRELGTAMLHLEQGDTATAVAQLGNLADSLDPPAAAAFRLFAANLAIARADSTQALGLAIAADTSAAPATSPSARLLSARIVAARGDTSRAERLLESLIIDFPESAMVPEARRLRNRINAALRGGRKNG